MVRAEALLELQIAPPLRHPWDRDESDLSVVARGSDPELGLGREEGELCDLSPELERRHVVVVVDEGAGVEVVDLDLSALEADYQELEDPLTRTRRPPSGRSRSRTGILMNL